MAGLSHMPFLAWCGSRPLCFSRTRCSAQLLRSGAPLIRDRSTSCPLETRDRPDSEPGTIPGLQCTTPQGLRAGLRPGKVRGRCAGGGIAESAVASSYTAMVVGHQGVIEMAFKVV